MVTDHRRVFSLLAASVIGAASLSASCTEPGVPGATDSLSSQVNRRVYDSVGSLTVVPLGSWPIDGSVTAMDLNDSNVVVGYITVPASTQIGFAARRAF